MYTSDRCNGIQPAISPISIKGRALPLKAKPHQVDPGKGGGGRRRGARKFSGRAFIYIYIFGSILSTMCVVGAYRENP